MGTMNRMRENTGVILWILVLSFGGLWVLQDSGVFDTIGIDPLSKVIIVDGDPITYDTYNRQLQAQLDQVRQMTGADVGPEQLEIQRERAFDLLVENKLREHEMDRIGITVSDAEIMDLILGDDPHEIIRANFSSDGGTLNRALLQNVIDDPAQEAIWVQLEQYIRVDRRREKFDALVNSTVRVSEADIIATHQLRSRTAEAEFFFLRYADIPDDSVSISDREVERWYNDNREEYRRERMYSIEMAVRSRAATKEDTLAIMRELDRLRPDFETTDNDSLFVVQSGSETGWSNSFLSASASGPEVAPLLFETEDEIEVGQIVGPVLVGNQVQLIKVLASRPADDTNVRARHILARTDEDNPDLAQQKIASALQRIRNGEDFALVAEEMSEDPGTAQGGGDLGWFGPGSMVEPFQDAAFGARVGRVVGPVETDFGLHLIEVTHRASRDLQVARITFSLDASVATLNTNVEALEDLKYYAEEEGNFSDEANRRNITVNNLTLVEDQTSIPLYGISRAIPFFLKTAEEGDISPVIEMADVSLVVHVVSIQPEGFRPFEEVDNIARRRAMLDRKKALQVDKMRTAYENGGFDGLSEQLAIPAQTATVGFEQAIVGGIGRDLEFVGTVLGQEEGVDSGVIEGDNGTYVVRTITINEPPELSDSQREELRNELSRRLESMMRFDYIDTLKESADIEDLRQDLLQQ